MKKRTIRTLIILALIVCAVAAFVVVSTAEEAAPTQHTVYYHSWYKNNGADHFAHALTNPVSNKVTLMNEPYRNQNGYTLFGWYTLDGDFYQAGTVIMPDSDIHLYEAYGVEIGGTGDSAKNTQDFINAVSKKNMFIRLKTGVTLDRVVELPLDGHTVIDLNDKTLTFEETKDGTTYSTGAFKGRNSSLYIADLSSGAKEGKVVVNGGIDTKYPTTAMFDYTPDIANLKNDIEIRIFYSVEVDCKIGLVNVNTDISETGRTLNFNIYGDITHRDGADVSNYIIRSKGMKNASVTFYEKSTFKTSAVMLFEDIGENSGEVAGLYIKGGRINIDPKTTIISNEPHRFGVYITGGVFTYNIEKMFAKGNYVFEQNYVQNDDGFAPTADGYVLKTCLHDKKAIEITAKCEVPGNIVYTCSYCRGTIVEENVTLGHSLYKVLEKEIQITTEKTEPGEYGIYCQRCTKEEYYEIEYFYPSPQNVYVQVMIRDKEGNVKSYPVKATELFGSDLGERLQTFTTMLIEEKFKVDQSQIIGIEIPLGVKTIAGGIGKTDGKEVPRGLFYGNTHIEVITLPRTIETIEEYAFGNMKSLKTVKGLEYVSKEIKDFAFQQLDHPDTSEVEIPQLEFVDDITGDGSSLTLNVKKIGRYAFYNAKIKTLTLGKDVETIGDFAFYVDDSLIYDALGQQTFPLFVEVFLEEYTGEGESETTIHYGRKISSINTGGRYIRSLSSNQWFYDKTVTYAIHKYIIEPQEATCQQGGYNKQFCERCNVTTMADETEPLDHEFTVKTKVPGTCSMQGYTTYKCTMCDTLLGNPVDNPDGDDEGLWWNEGDDDFNFANHTFDKQVFWDGWEVITDICNNDYYIVDQCTGALCGAYTGEGVAISTEKTYKSEAEGGYGGLHSSLGKHSGDYMNPISKTPATCGSEGTQKLRCIYCETAFDEVIPATGRHSLAPDNNQKVLGTCQNEGKSVVVCTVCDYKKETALPKDEKNHEFGEWVTVIEATVEKAGTAKRECPCGETETKGIPVRTDIAEKKSKVWLIVAICAGVVIVGGGTFLTLYYTVLRKSPSKSYKYKFNTLGKR